MVMVVVEGVNTGSGRYIGVGGVNMVGVVVV